MVEGIEKGTYFIIRVGDKLCASNLLDIRKHIEQALDVLGHVNLVFDLSDCTYIDSNGIGLLANLQRKVSGKNGRIGVAAVSDDLMDVLNVANLPSIISVYKTTDELESQF